MKFTAKLGQLKHRGYKFQKLYAHDYITYRKEFWGENNHGKHFTIWLWSKDKQLEINDWYGNTESIINYFRANWEAQEIENKKNMGVYSTNAMRLLYNHDGIGEIINKRFEIHEEFKARHEDENSPYYNFVSYISI